MEKVGVILQDFGKLGHGNTSCDLNINYVLADLKMKAKPSLAKEIAQNYTSYRIPHHGICHQSPPSELKSSSKHTKAVQFKHNNKVH